MTEKIIVEEAIEIQIIEEADVVVRGTCSRLFERWKRKNIN